MRRLLVVLATVSLSWLAAGGPAVASDSPSAVDSTVHFKGTSVFTFGDGCSFVHQTFDSPFTDSQGHTGSFSLEGRVDFRSAVSDRAPHRTPRQ